jgi:endoglycosylceramidase
LPWTRFEARPPPRAAWTSRAVPLAAALALACGAPGAAPPAALTVGDASALLSAALAAPAPLRAQGEYFTDAAGRVVLLRGVNATGDAKVPGFRPLTSSAQLDPLPGLGVNALRLLFVWEALEPTRGAYDGSYLDYYEQVISWAEDHGLYVLVDFHQDAYSRYNIGGCGEGFPRWAVTSRVKPATPDNGPGCSDWGTRMIFDADHHTTWHEFHADSEGARSAYLEMVKAVATRASRHANVIGYDLINEPWGTDAELSALYEAVGAAIRERDPDRILFEPPHALVSGGIFGNGIPKVSFDNVAYSPHFYDPFIATVGLWWGDGPAAYLDPMQAQARRWGVPMVLGEFGAAASVSNAADYLEAVHGWLDSSFVSSFQWSWTPGWTPARKDGWNGEDFSIVDDKGLRASLFKPRPYPRTTAGVPGSFRRTAGGFTYRWTHAPALGATQIFLPAGYAAGKAISYAGSAVPVRCVISGQAMTCTGAKAGTASVTLR